MKKCLLLLAVVSYCPAFAQEALHPDKTYKNEFGIEITGLLKQFTNQNNAEHSWSDYLFSYRRHLKKGNIRFAAGGNVSGYDSPSSYPGDDYKYKHLNYDIYSRIGWEFISDISKRWQVCYGVDASGRYSYYKDDAPYFNAGYANGTETSGTIIGLGPMLGVRIKLTKRLSLLTETNYSLFYSIQKSRAYYRPVSSDYPRIPDVEEPARKKFYTYFDRPLAIYLTFDI